MVRVAYRISPLPNDAEHFKQFADAVGAFQTEKTVETQLEFVRSNVLNAKGKEYSPTMIKGILNNLESLNLLKHHGESTYELTSLDGASLRMIQHLHGFNRTFFRCYTVMASIQWRKTHLNTFIQLIRISSPFCLTYWIRFVVPGVI